MSEETRMIVGLIIGMILLIFMVVKTKIHVFPALIISAMVIGLLGGMSVTDLVQCIPDGFSNTLASIGVIIGFGLMLGKILEDSGATKVMSDALIRLLGKNKEEAALAIVGFIISLSIFCSSAFVILTPLVKGLSRKSKKSMVGLGIALAAGAVLSHSIVPPAVGPMGVCTAFGANISKMILFGTISCIPSFFALVLYAKYMGKQIYQIPGENGQWLRTDAEIAALTISETEEDENLPAVWKAFAPIVIPVVLIFANSILSALHLLNGAAGSALTFFGTPVVALGIGLLLAIYLLTPGMTRQETLNCMDSGLKAAGKLMLLVGGGGILAKVIQVSGLGDFIATSIAQTAIPAILLPFIISVLVRLIQGSGTVAMLTAASVVQPMLGTLGLDPVFAALAACTGSLFFSYFNDSYFWIINETLGVEDTKSQMRVWTVTTTMICLINLVMLLILNMFFG